jgi:hypothetical protein
MRHLGAILAPSGSFGTRLTLFLVAIALLSEGAHCNVPRRGMYVSMDSYLGYPTLEEPIFNYSRTRGVNALSLYDLEYILPNRASLLRSFVTRARRIGRIRWVEAIAATSNAQWSKIATYQEGCTSDDEKFDGALTEIEYWNSGGNVNKMLNPVYHMRSLNPVPRLDPINASASRFYYASYIGASRPNDIKVDMARALDFVFIHAYTLTPEEAFEFSRRRVFELLQSPILTAVIIFSTEGTEHRNGDEIFMGDWLSARPTNTMQSAEAIYSSEFAGNFTGTQNASRVWGFQWFLYYFNALYDTNANHVGPWLASNPSITWTLMRTGITVQNRARCTSGGLTVCAGAGPMPAPEMASDAIVVDLFDVTQQEVAALKPRNVTNGASVASLPDRIVVCAFDGGVYEPSRLDAANFTTATRRGAVIGSPSNAEWIDILAAPQVLDTVIKPALRWRVALAATKRCDAVVLGGLTCFERVDCRLAVAEPDVRVGQIAIATWLALQAHGFGIAVGYRSSNGSLAPDLSAAFDFGASDFGASSDASSPYAWSAFARFDKAVLRLGEARGTVAPSPPQPTAPSTASSPTASTGTPPGSPTINTMTTTTTAGPAAATTQTSPQATSATTQPSTTPALPKRYRIRIRGSGFGDLLDSPELEEQLRVALQVDVARIIRVTRNRIVVRVLRLGSLIADFDVVDQAGNEALPPVTNVTTAIQNASLVGQAFTSVQTLYVFNTSAGQQGEQIALLEAAEIDVQGDSATPVPSRVNASEGCTGSCAVFALVIGVFAAAIIAAVVVVCCCCRKTPPEKEAEHDNDDSHRQTLPTLEQLSNEVP